MNNGKVMYMWSYLSILYRSTTWSCFCVVHVYVQVHAHISLGSWGMYLYSRSQNKDVERETLQ